VWSGLVLPFNHPAVGRLRARRTQRVSASNCCAPTLLLACIGHQLLNSRAGSTRPPWPKDCAGRWRCPAAGFRLCFIVCGRPDRWCCWVRPAGVPSALAPWLFVAFTILVPAALGIVCCCAPCWRGQCGYHPSTTLAPLSAQPWPARCGHALVGKVAPRLLGPLLSIAICRSGRPELHESMSWGRAWVRPLAAAVAAIKQPPLVAMRSRIVQRRLPHNPCCCSVILCSRCRQSATSALAAHRFGPSRGGHRPLARTASSWNETQTERSGGEALLLPATISGTKRPRLGVVSLAPATPPASGRCAAARMLRSAVSTATPLDKPPWIPTLPRYGQPQRALAAGALRFLPVSVPTF